MQGGEVKDKITEGRGRGPDIVIGTTCWRVGFLDSDPEPYLSLYTVVETGVEHDMTAVVTLRQSSDNAILVLDERFVTGDVVDDPMGRVFLTRRAALESLKAFAERKRTEAKTLEDEADMLEEYVERTIWELVG